MKARNGFVSNSSSSSFVVGFPERLQTVQDVHKYISNYPYAERIFDIIEGQRGILFDKGLTNCEKRSDENCEKCAKRFKCFTGVIENTDEIAKSIIIARCGEEDYERYYKNEPDYLNWYRENVIEHWDDFAGKYAYVIRLADGGEGGDELESEMRYQSDEIFDGLPGYDIT